MSMVAADVLNIFNYYDYAGRWTYVMGVAKFIDARGSIFLYSIVIC